MSARARWDRILRFLHLRATAAPQVPRLMLPPRDVYSGHTIGICGASVKAGDLLTVAMFEDPIDAEIQRAPERGWMQTYSGRKFFPLAPRAEDVELADIAHGLAMTCRYGGHARTFYSVAEHCVLVSEAVERHAFNAVHSTPTAIRYAREGLLHDSAEAYIGDMIRPLKHQPEMIEFRNAEDKIERAVFQKFGIKSTADSHAAVKAIDNRILVDEITQLMPDPSMYLTDSALADESALGIEIQGWQPERAKREFLARFRLVFQ